MIENTNIEIKQDFFENIAKKWQDYIPYNFIEGIDLSLDQKKVIDLFEDQLMVMGCAGSGKSITLLYKMIRSMIGEIESKRILYVSYNQSLIDDARKRAKRSQEFKELEVRHQVEIKTFHYMVHDLLKLMRESVKSIYMSYEKMEKNTDDAVGRVYSAMIPYIKVGEMRY
ncbi:MAG: UvrD-helicase domain-containing protein, partial [Cellulosilyticaceae bacterium]